MVMKCFNCKAKTGLHCIPRSQKILMKWKEVIPDVSESTFDKNFKLCSVHFEEKLVVNGRLVWDAIPTKFVTSDGSWFTIDSLDNNCSPHTMADNKNYSSSIGESSSGIAIKTEKPNTVSSGNTIRYSGDVNEQTMKSPGSAKKAFEVCKREIGDLRRDKKVLQQKLKRMKIKLKNLEGFLKDLEDRNIISNACYENLNELKDHECFIEELQTDKEFGDDTPTIRQFAMIMSLFSVNGYELLRNYIKDLIYLPHVSKIRQWYSNMSGSPGITAQAIDEIRKKIQSETKTLYFSLMMHKIELKVQQDWDEKKNEYMGFIDLGAGNCIVNEDDKGAFARTVLVFSVCCINEKFELPIGYFFIVHLTASEEASIVQLIISQLYQQCKAQIISFTFDGSSSRTIKSLGAELPNKPYFEVENVPNKIVIIFDNCCMVKSIRNNFSYQLVMYNGENKIEWKYLELLINIQMEKGFALAPKLKPIHINFNDFDMNVEYAVQLLSLSTSNALKHLRDEKEPNFENCLPTVKFLKLINDCFDIFNSNSTNAKYQYKRELSKNTFEIFYERLNILKELFNKLEHYCFHYEEIRKVLGSQFQSGFLGFIVNFESLKILYNNFILTDKLDYILMHKFSLDHLLFFFNATGSNHDPTCTEFKALYQAVIANNCKTT